MILEKRGVINFPEKKRLIDLGLPEKFKALEERIMSLDIEPCNLEKIKNAITLLRETESGENSHEVTYHNQKRHVLNMVEQAIEIVENLAKNRHSGLNQETVNELKKNEHLNIIGVMLHDLAYHKKHAPTGTMKTRHEDRSIELIYKNAQQLGLRDGELAYVATVIEGTKFENGLALYDPALISQGEKPQIVRDEKENIEAKKEAQALANYRIPKDNFSQLSAKEKAALIMASITGTLDVLAPKKELDIQKTIATIEGLHQEFARDALSIKERLVEDYGFDEKELENFLNNYPTKGNKASEVFEKETEAYLNNFINITSNNRQNSIKLKFGERMLNKNRDVIRSNERSLLLILKNLSGLYKEGEKSQIEDTIGFRTFMKTNRCQNVLPFLPKDLQQKIDAEIDALAEYLKQQQAEEREEYQVAA